VTMPASPAEAVRVVRARSPLAPDVAVILGTGLGALAEQVESATAIPYADIPGFPLATV
jgi:purine nucleoside phosphorylase